MTDSPTNHLAIFSFGNITPSLILSLTRIQPYVSKITLFCKESKGLIDRLPRHILVESGPFDFWKKVKEFPPQTVVVSFHERENLLMSPDAVPLAASVALGSPGKYVTLVDPTGKAESLGIMFLGNCHWTFSSSPCSSFITTASVLLQDEEVIKKFWNMHPSMFWSTLQTLRNRKCLCPIPSLATSLPLDDSAPPGVNWKQLQEFVEKTIPHA